MSEQSDAAENRKKMKDEDQAIPHSVHREEVQQSFLIVIVKHRPRRRVSSLLLENHRCYQFSQSVCFLLMVLLVDSSLGIAVALIDQHHLKQAKDVLTQVRS